jgi:hypothetical protein
MTTNAVAEPILLPNYINNARRLLGASFARRHTDQWNAANQLTQFIKSIDRVFATISQGLPQTDLVIEDMIINGDKLVVKYKSQNSNGKELPGTLTKEKAVDIKSLDILNLRNGEVIERQNTVYQIKI